MTHSVTRSTGPLDPARQVQTARRGTASGLVALLFGVSGRRELTGRELRALLADLGLSDDAARAHLARMVRAGDLTSTREGREAHYRMAGAFASGFEKIRRTMATPEGEPAPAWDGRFHTLMYAVPESDRAYRDALRRAAVLAGYGLLQPGVLVAPRDLRENLRTTLAERPDGVRITAAWTTPDDSDAVDLVVAAWRLTEVAARYVALASRIEQALRTVEPEPGPAALGVLAAVVAPALTATLAEPDVPTRLLPADWPGPRLRRLVAECSASFGPAAGRHVEARLIRT